MEKGPCVCVSVCGGVLSGLHPLLCCAPWDACPKVRRMTFFLVYGFWKASVGYSFCISMYLKTEFVQLDHFSVIGMHSYSLL